MQKKPADARLSAGTLSEDPFPFCHHQNRTGPPSQAGSLQFGKRSSHVLLANPEMRRELPACRRIPLINETAHYDVMKATVVEWKRRPDSNNLRTIILSKMGRQVLAQSCARTFSLERRRLLRCASVLSWGDSRVTAEAVSEMALVVVPYG